MRRATIMSGIRGATLVSLAVLSSAALGGGCLDSSSDCELTNTCASGDSTGVGGAGGHAGSPATGGSGGGTAGQGGAEPGSCVPSENGEGVGVPASCGLFVAADGSGDGSQQSPFGTVGEGLAAAAEAGDRVYVCEGAYVQSVVVPHGVKVYGGLDCGAGWTFTAGDKSTLVGEAHEPAVRLAGDSEKSTILADLRIEAPSATNAGASSIGVLVEGGQLQLENVDVIASDGADGEVGGTPDTYIGPTDPDNPAIQGNGPRSFAPGSCNGINYNWAPEQSNALCPTSVGGRSGTGEFGGPPQPGLDGEVSGGGGGTNTGSLPGACSIFGCCRANGSGDAGSKGAEGDPGAGASGEGTLSTAGWQGTMGESAARGAPGSGGGGGAGAEAPSGESCGAGGNGGGAGGCGGFGGDGGGPGGGSFAVIVLGGELTTTGGSLVTGDGGDGGDGGAGQAGAVGGNGGSGGVCSGGKGGDGGDGGQGGGGLGGHSIAVAIGLGSATVGESTTVTVGSAGNGGDGGDAPGQGDDGVAEATYTLDVL
jgi:hypothetical protein